MEATGLTLGSGAPGSRLVLVPSVGASGMSSRRSTAQAMTLPCSLSTVQLSGVERGAAPHLPPAEVFAHVPALGAVDEDAARHIPTGDERVCTAAYAGVEARPTEEELGVVGIPDEFRKLAVVQDTGVADAGQRLVPNEGRGDGRMGRGVDGRSSSARTPTSWRPRRHRQRCRRP